MERGPQTVKGPDGGYGWVVMLCSMGCQYLFATNTICFSMLMVEFSETFGASLAAIGVAGAIFHATFSLAGILYYSYITFILDIRSRGQGRPQKQGRPRK